MNLKLYVKRAACTMAAIVMVGGAAFAASPSDVYQKAVQNMSENPQGEYTVHLALKMPMIGSADVNNVIDIQNEPFKTKSTTTVSVFGNKHNDPITTYAEQDGDAINIYYAQTEDKKTTWKKATQKLSSSAPIAQSFRQTKNPLAGVKTVTNSGNEYTVTYDSKQIYNENDKQKWQKSGYTKEQINTIASVLQALQNAGDVTAKVTIDPATNRISRVTVPLTEQMRGGALAIINQVKTSDANKAVIQQFIKFSDVDMTIDCNRLPAGIDLAVPSDVKAKAEEDIKTVKK